MRSNILHPNELILKLYSLLFISFFFTNYLRAQTDIFSLAPKHDSIKVKDDSKEKDLADVYFKVIGKTGILHLQINNVRTRSISR